MKLIWAGLTEQNIKVAEIHAIVLSTIYGEHSL
jgi:hypothetical protein